MTLADGSEVSAETVVASIDARRLPELLPSATLSRRYQQRLVGSLVSESAFCLYLTTTLALVGLPYESVALLNDAETSFLAGRDGQVSMVTITIATIVDRSRAREGEHTIMLTSMAPAHPMSSGERRRMALAMLELAERVIPDLRQHAIYVHGRTADEAWPLFERGPMYGWAITPDQSALGRLPHRTPVAGLWLSGHWSQPAAGAWGAVASGIRLARLLLQRADRQPPATGDLRGLQHPATDSAAETARPGDT